jgi:hypothetical protein
MPIPEIPFLLVALREKMGAHSRAAAFSQAGAVRFF